MHPEEAEQSEAFAVLSQAFSLDAPAARLPASQRPSLEDVRHFLIERIGRLLSEQPALLMSLLYRIDVDEADVRRTLAESPPSRLPADLADLVIERQLAKVRMRHRYREGGTQ
ncbi:MAG: hypothetical protein ACR2GR_02680 [Rhodothermales bacterium]